MTRIDGLALRLQRPRRDLRRALQRGGRGVGADRDRPNTVFAPGSGVTQRASDWIVAGDAQPWKGFRVFARTRLDRVQLQVHLERTGPTEPVPGTDGHLRLDRGGVAAGGRTFARAHGPAPVYSASRLRQLFHAVVSSRKPAMTAKAWPLQSRRATIRCGSPSTGRCSGSGSRVGSPICGCAISRSVRFEI